MRAEDHRWGFVRIALECPGCDGRVPVGAPALEARCPHCEAVTPVPEGVYTALAMELADDPEVLRAAFAGGDQGHQIICGRAAPRCGGCGEPLPLSAADVGVEREIHCPGCDAITQTTPAPSWLGLHLPGALQIYATPAGHEPGAEAVWLRCAQCDAGLRLDAQSPRIARCAACHGHNHVPDAAWRALHPRRHPGAWYVLFEPLTPAERAARRADWLSARAAVAALSVATPAAERRAHLRALQALPPARAEDALLRAVVGEDGAWFEAALAELVRRDTPRIRVQLLELMGAEPRPWRALGLAGAVARVEPEAAVEVYRRLIGDPTPEVAAAALEAWTRLSPEGTQATLRRLTQEAGPQAIVAGRLRLRSDPDLAGLPPDYAQLLEGTLARPAALLLPPASGRTRARALASLLEAGAPTRLLAAAVEVGPDGDRAALERALQSALPAASAVALGIELGWLRSVPTLRPLLHAEDPRIRAQVCRVFSAPDDAAAEAAALALLAVPRLAVRLAAVRALDAMGGEAALPELEALASAWFVNRELKVAARRAADAVGWRLRAEEGRLALVAANQGALSVDDS